MGGGEDIQEGEKMTIRDKFVYALALNYKGGYRNRVVDLDRFARETGADYEEVEGIAAGLRSEGSVTMANTRGTFRLTDAGYAKYRDRLAAIEALENAP